VESGQTSFIMDLNDGKMQSTSDF